ncbi:hypothetical protein AB0F91_11240 [Amycolatopsis sp. NPDC023774]|uniref:hypothetical protein n=1 Tax=Amycolatopsis sp. NPDC023774 TaxID=3155015 RepID=UPI0033F945DF
MRIRRWLAPVLVLALGAGVGLAFVVGRLCGRTRWRWTAPRCRWPGTSRARR